MDGLISRVLAIGGSSDDAHAGMLDQSEYNHFWATLCDQDAATQFMAAALDKLVALRVRLGSGIFRDGEVSRSYLVKCCYILC
jgi:hypothetical protein